MFTKSMTWSEHDWSIYSKGIMKMLQKSVRKVLESISTFSKLDWIANSVMFTKKYHAIRAWLMDLQGLQILKVAKRGQKALGSSCNI